jgi:hypothetical protein
VKRALWIAVVCLLALPVASADAHPERATLFPAWAGLKYPTYRKSGPRLVVCRSDSKQRLKRIYKGKKHRKLLKARLALLKQCAFTEVQHAVDAAKSGSRILLMPGRYTEPSARKIDVGSYQSGPCANDYVVTEGFNRELPPPAGPRSNDPPVRPDRNFQIKCPNSKNLVAVIGDTRPEPTPAAPSVKPQCLQKCNLQIEGLGRRPTDVVLVGDRKKMDVLRVDRAQGVYLRNFTVEQAAFNGIDLVEVEGFVIKDVVARDNADYGVLTFTSGNGLYDTIDAYGNGDSGVYPGSNQKGCDIDYNASYASCASTGCQYWTTEIRNVDSHDNVLGYSGTAGNSTWVHDSRFHDNATGLSTDSFASGHPGMPQECFKWEHNQIYSNNQNFFTAERQDYCNRTKFEDLPKTIVCPHFQTAVGTGILIGGGNRDLVRDNHIYDNWRNGVTLLWVPAAVRGDNAPEHQDDTSNGNQFVDNAMGFRPDGTRDPNGTDFWWDEQGVGNCWQGNTVASKSDPAALPTCDKPSSSPASRPDKTALLVPCTAWDPERNPRPVGCDWFDVPPEPK